MERFFFHDFVFSCGNLSETGCLRDSVESFLNIQGHFTDDFSKTGNHEVLSSNIIHKACVFVFFPKSYKLRHYHS